MCRLESLTEHSMCGLENLETLDLSDNALTFVEGAFKSMSRLNRLDLRNNSLTTLTRFTLRDLVSLQYLLLGGNRISTIDPDTFRGLDRLTYIVLRNNPLGAVERIHIRAPSLAFVDLSECNLQRLPRGLPPSIRYLQLRRNNMTTLSKTAFVGCPYIGILILDDNNITIIGNKTFSHMTHLQQLWLNNNQLTSVPTILAPSLQRLYLDNNRLSTLTDAFPSNSQIDTVSLMGNRIQEVTSDALLQLPKLRSLDLGNNRITQLHSYTFSKCAYLTKLVLSKNPLHTFNQHCLHGVSSLQSLALTHINTAPTLSPELFDDLHQLRTLDLTNSPDLIQVFLQAAVSKSPETHSNPAMAVLEELSLLSSQLTQLPQGIFDAFPALQELQLSSMRFHCDVSMVWLRNWLRETRVRVRDRLSLVCHSPRRLYLRPIARLADNEFAPFSPPSTRATVVREQTSGGHDVLSADHSGSGVGNVPNYDDITNDDIEYDDSELAKLKKDQFHSSANSIPHSISTGVNVDANSKEKNNNFENERDTWNLRNLNDTMYPDVTTETNNAVIITSTTIVVLTGAITVSAAIILIFIIVRLSHKQSTTKQLIPSGPITLKHVSNGSSSQAVKPSKTSYNEQKFPVNDCTSMPCAVKSKVPVKDTSTTVPLIDNSMALEPKSDINHEGKQVMYTWEKF